MSQIEAEINIRPRTLWEALDLGFAMARQWWQPLALLWCVGALPLFASYYLVFGLSTSTFDILGWVLLWWLKPLYEWPLLDYLSRVVFDAKASVWQSLTVYRKSTIKQLLPFILWRRFSLYRGLTMSVSLLERLHGDEYKQRAELLTRGQNAVPWLLLVCLHFEWVISLGLYLTVLFFSAADDQSQSLVTYLVLETERETWIDVLIMLFSWLAIAPFFISASFAAYLSRRTELEAWDLELVFRAIGRRWQPVLVDQGWIRSSRQKPLKGSSLLALPMAVMLALMSFAMTPNLLQAAEHSDMNQRAVTHGPAMTVSHSDDAKQLIDAVLADETYGRKETRSTWRYRQEFDEQSLDPDWGFDGVLSGILGNIFLLIIWLLVFAGAIWLVWYCAVVLGWVHAEQETESAQTETPIRSLDLAPSSLPKDIPVAVAEMLRQQQYRDALALLFNACVAQVAEQADVMLPDSATEAECGRWLAHYGNEQQSQYFQQLMQIWIRTAYAGQQAMRKPDTELWQLQATWSDHFKVVD